MSLVSILLPRVRRSISALRLVPSDGGKFEVTCGGELIYSKLATGEFPEEEPLVAEIEKRCGVA